MIPVSDGRIKMDVQKELRDYINNNFISSHFFMSTVRDQIRYIYEPSYPSVSAVDRSTYAANLIGIYARGHFYSLSYEYRSFDLDFMEELQEFEAQYESAFDKLLRSYSSSNPIGGKISEASSERLNTFMENDLARAVSDIIFGSRNKLEKKTDHKKYESVFLKYILLGNKFLEDAVNADINENADDLNFRIISEETAYKYAVKQLNTESMINRVTVYGIIKKSNHSQYRLSVNFEGLVLDNIYIDAERLLRVIKLNEEITSNTLSATDRNRLQKQDIDISRLKVNFDDILKIEYRQQLYYNKVA